MEVLTWRGLVTYYILFFIEIGTRRVCLGGITRHPVMSENQICLRLLGLQLAPQPGVTQRYVAKIGLLTLS